jgi:hypothetical protein
MVSKFHLWQANFSWCDYIIIFLQKRRDHNNIQTMAIYGHAPVCYTWRSSQFGQVGQGMELLLARNLCIKMPVINSVYV